jgi:hypothetical protein
MANPNNNTEINVLRDWDFDVNLSGLTAPTGKGGNVLPEGYYKVKLTDLYINPDRNPNRVIVKMQVSEGPFTGVFRTDGFNRPGSEDDKVRYYWRGLAESAGYTTVQLDSGVIQLGLATFQDRIAHIYYVPKAEDGGRGEYQDITFLPPTEWAQQMQNFEMSGGVAKAEAATRSATSGAGAGSALGSSPAPSLGKIEEPQPMSGGGDSNTTKRSALMSQLGVN